MCRQSHGFGWASVLALLLALGLNLDTTPALAHGEATIVVSPAVVAPGDTIDVEGEGVESGGIFTVTLEGMSFQATLGMVTVADGETFRQEFGVPADVPPGTYQVRAISQEGEVLRVELAVEARATTTESVAAVEPSAALMQLDRTKPTGELSAIVGVLLVSAGLGLALVYVRR